VANTIIKAGQIVDAAILLLNRELVLPRTVWRQPDAEFRGALNDTVTLRVPAMLTSRSRTMRSSSALQADTLAETSVPVQLTDHVYSLLNLSDEELTLDIINFSRQVLAPQMQAVAEGMEDVVADTLSAATVSDDQELSFGDSDDPYEVLVDAGAVLSHLKVPKSERFCVCGTNVEAALLKTDKFVKVNESGTSEALREATISRAAGFTIIGSLALDPDEAFAYHRTAVAFANVAPALPDGAVMKARNSLDGLAMRFIKDYNPTNSTGPVDRSLVDAFVGAASVEQDTGDSFGDVNRRLVKITYTGTGPIST
jgi:hypothetical protein